MQVGSQNRPVEVALGVVVRLEGAAPRILVSRRRQDAALGGFWEFPGGKLEAGETLEACAVREVMEEVGVSVTALARLKPSVHVYPHARVALHPVLCRYDTGEPQALGVADWAWVAPEALSTLSFPQANAALLPGILTWIEQAIAPGSDHDFFAVREAQ